VDAIKVDNNLARIDHGKCIVCGLCVKKCPTGAIHDYIPVRPKAYIDPSKCAGIDVCEKVCPVNAISGEIGSIHTVNQEKCIGCRMCESRCPKKAITMVEGPANAVGKEPVKAKEPVSV
jgi:Na+-translocating ferredoxin:NAD+ oxidoreductase subunit B